MKIAVIGPGAMGLLFAAYLKEGGLEVVLLDHRPERAKRLSKTGITVEGVRGEHRVQVPATCDASAAGPVDLVMVWVKAYHTEKSLMAHRVALGPETLVYSAQNGIGSLDAIRAVVGPERVLAGTTTLGAYLRGEGRVRHAAEGDTFLGEPGGGVSERVISLCRVLSAAGVTVKPAADIRRAMWEKLAMNAAINPLTALLRVPNGKLLELPAARRLMKRVVEEVVEVARGQGVNLAKDALQKRVLAVARSTAWNRSSMLQDVEAGRRTEVAFINGAVAALGQAPLNQALAELVEARADIVKISSWREREPLLYALLENAEDPWKGNRDGT